MSYHALGAGPGPVKTYYVDLPFPWGDNTEVDLPMSAMAQDAYREVAPYMPALAKSAFSSIEADLDARIERVQKDLDKALTGVYVAAGVIVLSMGIFAWSLKKR